MELTEPARSLVGSLLNPTDAGWYLDARSNSYVTKGELTVDSIDGELMTLECKGTVRLGYLKEYRDVCKAARWRLQFLQESQKAAVAVKMIALVNVVTGAKR